MCWFGGLAGGPSVVTGDYCRTELFGQRVLGRSGSARDELRKSVVAAMQFIKSQKEHTRRYVTISRSPVLISDAARGALSVGTPQCP